MTHLTDTPQPESHLRSLSTALCLTLVLGAASCGSDNSGDKADAASCPPTTGRYLPLVDGASWTHRITDPTDGTISVKTQIVGPIEDLGGDKAGIMAYKLTTTKYGGIVVSWQEDTGDRILRHREVDMAGNIQADEIFQPYKLRIDETAAHTAPGASWVETYDEITDPTGPTPPTTTSKSETWTVEAVDEPVTVPAGTFCALRVRKVSMANATKIYWFVRGLGKVKEWGDRDRLEELTEYTLP